MPLPFLIPIGVLIGKAILVASQVVAGAVITITTLSAVKGAVQEAARGAAEPAVRDGVAQLKGRLQGG